MRSRPCAGRQRGPDFAVRFRLLAGGHVTRGTTNPFHELGDVLRLDDADYLAHTLQRRDPTIRRHIAVYDPDDLVQHRRLGLCVQVVSLKRGSSGLSAARRGLPKRSVILRIDDHIAVCLHGKECAG